MGNEFSDHVRELLLHRFLIVVLASILGVAAWTWRTAQPPVYRSTAVSQVVLDGTERFDDGTVTEFRSRTLAELGTTPAILTGAVAASGLSIDAADAAELVEISLRDSTGFIEISATGPTPSDAAALANAVVANMSSTLALDGAQGSRDELRIVEAAQEPQTAEPDGALLAGVAAALMTAIIVAEGAVAVRILRGRLSPIDPAAELERLTGVPTFDLGSGLPELPFYRRHLAPLPTVTVLAPDEIGGRVAVELARLAGGIHQRVLVIDGDQLDPQLHRLLKLERAPGVTDLAVGGRSLREVARPGPLGGRVAILTGGSALAAPPLLRQRTIEEAVARSGADQSIIVRTLGDDDPFATSSWPGLDNELVLVLNVDTDDRRAAMRSIAEIRDQGARVAAILLIEPEQQARSRTR